VSGVSETHGKSAVVPTRVSRASVRLFFRASAVAAVAACALGTSACSALDALRSKGAAPAPQPAAASEEATPLSGPELSLASEDDFVVRIVAGAVSCTGSLIAEDRVLTAHHCVAVPRGKGENEAKKLSPEMVRVELGGDHLPWAEVGVRWIVTPNCGHNGGDGDIAILVLERRLNGVATRAPELDAVPDLGDPLVPIGFGRCADEGNGIVRQRRTGSVISRVLERRFQLQAAICPGDSGGPGLDPRTGRILGVISASVMDARVATLGLSEFTRLDRHRPVFAAAAELAEGASPAELPPIDCRN